MSDSRPAGEHDQTPLDPRGAIPDDRSSHGILGRTWELELLISGAVVFALMQLPPVLERGFDRFELHLSGWPRMAVFMAYMYGSAILYTLIASFLIHLTARAYWVGLIGLDSVFPQGVRWEEARSGPIARRVYSGILPSVRAMIVRTDRLCSVIFSFTFLIVTAFAMSIVMFALYGLIAYGLSIVLFGGGHLTAIFWTILLLFFFLFVAASTADKALGDRLDPEGLPARAIEKTLRYLVYPSQFGPVYSSISMVLFTNARKGMVYPLMMSVFLGMAGLFMVRQMIKQDLISLSRYEYLPEDAGEWEVDPVHYEDQRAEGEVFRTAPSIQSDVIRDPYVKLFIPYFPHRYDRLVESRCPEVRRRGREGSPGPPPRALLGCLRRILTVTLDGRPIPGLEFNFHSHPETGVRGLLGYIPTAGLARGSHLLRVEGIPGREENETEPRSIRFWM